MLPSLFTKKMNKRELNAELRRWEAFYANKGIEKDVYQIFLNYAKPLLLQDLPVIFDYIHLAGLLGLSPEFILRIVNSPESFYREFEIPKRSGGKRKIISPYDSLKYVQRWILENILCKVKVSGCAHGFVFQRSIITNATYHLQGKNLLKIDLKDFFPSIPKSFVIRVFQILGYSYKVSVYLACICCYDECLPQGAPTSPMLSNIISRHLDNRLKGLAKKSGNVYTRYADDIAFSGDNITIGFATTVKRIVEECGFQINENKVRLYNANGSKILTGLSLANGILKLPRNTRRKLEQELYYIKKYGLYAHINHEKIRNPRYLESMIGRLNFWLMVEPDNEFVKGAKDYLIDILKEKHLKLKS